MRFKAHACGPKGFGVYDIEATRSQVTMTASSTSAADETFAPGFFDIHIHGAFGIDFMSASLQDMELLGKKLQAVGYECFLPTTITAPAGDIRAALKNLPENTMVKGFHLEGPFISSAFPGAQPPNAIAEIPTDSEWDDILDDPRLRVITMAPEKVGALPLVSRLAKRHVSVSMGHSNATFAEAETAGRSGANHTTHTFNAMRGFHHREAGLAGYAMLEDTLFAELIYDRIHVSTQSARLLIKSKPKERLVAVSDSTMATGQPAGMRFKMWGLDCITAPGQVRLADSGNLAGSAITLYDAFTNLADDFGLETAIRACSINPRLSIGYKEEPRVFNVFSRDLEIKDRIELE
jgi:N-acetylglucosamine-6-phosphate deacetylase